MLTAIVRHSASTEQLGVAGREGIVFGETMPSSSHKEVVGSSAYDYAVYLYFEELKAGYFFAPELVEFRGGVPNSQLEVSVMPRNWVQTNRGTWILS